jgi:hypothetical protein
METGVARILQKQAKTAGQIRLLGFLKSRGKLTFQKPHFTTI